MLEQLLIFTRGGLILWTCKELGNALKGSPVDSLIKSCLLGDRSGDSSYDCTNYTLRWKFNNELGLVFVAVYQKILQLLYVEDLLSMVRREFSEIYDPKRTVYDDFDETFRQLRMEAEARAEELKKSNQAAKSVNNAKKKGKEKAGFNGGNKKKGDSGPKSDGGDGNGRKMETIHANGKIDAEETNVPVVANGKENASSNIEAFDVDKMSHKFRSKGGKKKDTVVNKGSKVDPKKKTAKKNRVWDDSPTESKLDFTDPADQNDHENAVVVVADEGESMMDKEEIVSSESEAEEDEEMESKMDTKKKGWFSSMFQR